MAKDFDTRAHRTLQDAPSALTVEDFNLWYGDFQALRHVTLDIPARRATAFIGPSGCGKSTLLRTFNRMCDFVQGVRTEGSVRFAGTDVFSMDANALRVHVGMVFQHPNPFPMSIRDNVLYGPARMGKLGRAQADELVEALPHRGGPLGRGQRQARQQRPGTLRRPAAAPVHRARPGRDPDVLLMDEPTSALDPISTLVVEELMGRLASGTRSSS